MTVPRVVLDSNVIISGFLFGGPPRRLLQAAMEGSVACFISPSIVDEIRSVLHRSTFGLTGEQIFGFIQEIQGLCQLVTTIERLHVVTRDPDDNHILECAGAARAAVIVSGDTDLRDLGAWNGIRILSPAVFVRELDGA